MSDVPEGYATRAGTLKDCPKLPEIELAAAEMFRPLNLVDFENGPHVVSLEYLKQQCSENLLWVAVQDEVAVGFVVADVRGDDFYIAELDVHPDHGRKGLGAALMQAACDAAFAGGFARVTLNTFRDVAWNAPFYARLGFAEIAEADWKPWMHDLAKRMTGEGLDLANRVFMELRR